MEVRGSVVLVTGASSGIGRATALALDAAGARVAMAARRRDRLEENAARMTGALVVPTDAADSSQVEAMVDRTVEHFGRLDVLINNAGASRMSRTDALDADSVRRLLEVNFIAAVTATNRASITMRRQHGGLIVNVGSPGALLGVPLFASYAASKAAMHGWTTTLQSEWAGSEIFVAEYQPGLISTEIHQASVAGTEFEGVAADELFSSATEAISPQRVAADLIECIRRPRLTMYSSQAARYGCALSYIDSVRLRLVTRLAAGVRRRTNLAVFTDSD